MPELPEVKTIQDQLNAIMPFQIESCALSEVADSIVHTPMDGLVGQSFVEVRRKGKLLDFILDDGRHLLSHLGMSGAWLISEAPITVKHTHVRFWGMICCRPNSPLATSRRLCCAIRSVR